MQSPLPIIVIEVVMVFGGALAFAWWQLRTIRKDRERAAEARRLGAEAEARSTAGEGPAPDR